MWFQKCVVLLLVMILKYLVSPALPAATALFLIAIVSNLVRLWLFFSKKSLLIIWTILNYNSSNLSLPIILDSWGLLFASIVFFISANIIIFSLYYIEGDKSLSRFIHLILLFVASIIFLILIPNIITLLLGWDGLGLVSFILVIFYQNNKSLAAGIITALTNRIGDVLILLAIIWILSQGHWFILSPFFSALPNTTALITIIIMAAITKRAQIPFRSWLPAAMAAPTPVSALVHSSTLVTAGVFLLLRLYPFLCLSPIFNVMLLIAGSSTILIAGTVATLENDMKKVIALSTLRQLGVIMTRLSLGIFTFTFFHLISHALFKALLFICAGNIIHLHHHSQDLRFIGNIRIQSPLINSCLVVSNLALCGAPFLAGFYSKDIIIESSLFIFFNNVITVMFLVATLLTAAYSTRFLIRVTIAPRASLPISPINDKRLLISTPTLNLRVGAITAGAIISWFAIAPILETPLPLTLKTIALFLTLGGGVLLMIAITTKFNTSLTPIISFSKAAFFITAMWSLTPTSSQLLLKHPFFISKASLKLIDQGWLEILGPQGLFWGLSTARSYQNQPQQLVINKQLVLIFSFVLFSLL